MEVKHEELEKIGQSLWNEKCSPEIYDEGYIKIGNVKGCYPRSYLEFYPIIKSFEIRKDDIFVISFPKCGTTWTQEMVWCIMNNLNFEAAKEDLNSRFPYFEVRANWSEKLNAKIHRVVLEELGQDLRKEEKEENSFFINSFKTVENLPSPRFIKSHLHYEYLPTEIFEVKPKIIYVARNPKDACISFYHHSKLLDGYLGNLDDFVQCFISDNVFCAPYWSHLNEFWLRREEPNILFLKYEDMKNDLKSIIRQVAKFLEKEMTEDQVSLLEEHLSFENMKNNPAVDQQNVIKNLRKIHGQNYEGNFIRKGQIGSSSSWKDELGPENAEKLDKWISENKIKGLY